jgi:hypothetical protein
MATCSGQQRGSQTTVVIDFETTYGSDPGTPAGIQTPFSAESLSASREQLSEAIINGRRDPSRPFAGNTDVTGDITVPVDLRYIGYWFKALMGAPTTSGAGPYTHVYKVDNTGCMPSLVYEKAFLDVPRYLKYNGVKLSSMALSAGSGGELNINFGLVGSSFSDSGTAYDATPTTHTYERFKNNELTLKEGGSTTGEFSQLSIDVNTNLDTDVFTIGGAGTRSSLPEGQLEIGGSGNILFDNMTMYNKALNATESSIELIATQGTSSLSIDLNEAEYALSSPKITGNEGIMLDLDFKAFFDNDGGDSSIIITLINDVASY